MSRYKVSSPWSTATTVYDPYIVQVADIIDTRNGTTYRDGAQRVVLHGKPAKRGKGGTVPFYGESAWMDAERLAGDLQWSTR